MRRDTSAHHTLPLQGQRITMMSFDLYSPILRLYARYQGAPHVELSIETRIAIHRADHSEEFDLEADLGAAAASLVPLLGQTATMARAQEDGTLNIELDGGARLLVVPHPRFEAWQLHCDDGAVFVANPGGGLAIWRPKRESN
ncbi:MAG: DUF6188 family protein [Chloroflexota bacterium]